MAPGTRSHDPKTYILNFFFDDDDCSALTARINDHRFHIIVEPGKLRKTGGVANGILREYKQRLEALRQASAPSSQETEGRDAERARHDPDEGVVRCVCGATNDEDGLLMVACEECGVWQHNACMSFTQDEEELDTAKYCCEECKPKRHSQLLLAKKKHRRPWEERKKRALEGEQPAGQAESSGEPGEEGYDIADSTEDDADSAVEVEPHGNEDGKQEKRHANRPQNSNDSGVDVSQDRSELELDLQNWIMSCLGSEVQRVAPPDTESAKLSVFDWYTTPSHFYELEVVDDALKPVEIKDSKSLQRRLDELVPYLDIPKYIRNLPIPFVDPTALTVVHTSEAIDPVHPSIVSHEDKEYFFKPVNPAEPAPTKREISLLHKIDKLGLREQIKVPQVHYLVSTSPGEKASIMGFLQTAIPDPTPLTKLMDSDVSETKRRRWAKESERIVRCLHENDIIWGDAKGDNFVVDQSDDLWIIDFGGSYTEGWVDPELMETEEGDDAGLDKVLSALDDPDGNTFDPEEEIAPDSKASGGGKQNGKRERRTCEHWEDDWEERQTAKKSKQS